MINSQPDQDLGLGVVGLCIVSRQPCMTSLGGAALHPVTHVCEPLKSIDSYLDYEAISWVSNLPSLIPHCCGAVEVGKHPAGLAIWADVPPNRSIFHKHEHVQLQCNNSPWNNCGASDPILFV
jgi:hypothetical protein